MDAQLPVLGDRYRSLDEDFRGNPNLNPYEPTTVTVRSSESRWGRRLTLLLVLHVLALVVSTFVVRSESVLSDRYFELLVAAPLAISTLLFPLAIVFVTILSERRLRSTGCVALAADLMISAVQFSQWIPAVQ
jgi:hypothetical protein